MLPVVPLFYFFLFESVMGCAGLHSGWNKHCLPTTASGIFCCTRPLQMFKSHIIYRMIEHAGGTGLRRCGVCLEPLCEDPLSTVLLPFPSVCSCNTCLCSYSSYPCSIVMDSSVLVAIGNCIMYSLPSKLGCLVISSWMGWLTLLIWKFFTDSERTFLSFMAKEKHHLTLYKGPSLKHTFGMCSVSQFLNEHLKLQVCTWQEHWTHQNKNTVQFF